ncbi:hypothetical protein [Conexibacter woesei]|uniref:hypothetical protein n=1 Tax=Conexibacter woesei TaxID=191495 RepID=UPI00047ABF55|nr:hypothetical protein [Conexibacter woesei]
MRVRRRRPHLATAVPLALALALVPAAGANAAAKPKLSVTAKAGKSAITVSVKASAAGRVAVAVKASGSSTIARGSTSLKRGATRTLSLKTTKCRACRQVKVVGTLTPQSGRPVTSTTTVTLPATTTTTTSTTATTTTAAAPAAATRPAATTTTTAAAPPAPAPARTTTTTSTSTTTTTAPVPPVSVASGTTVAGAAGAGTSDAVAATRSRLTWAPPRLVNPITINVTTTNRSLRLDAGKDYIVSMPAGALTGGYGVVINGGHNVVLIGGEIDIPWQGDPPPVNSRRGLYLQNQTGTVHVEGLWIHGADLSEGIDLDERLGATVQIQDVRIDGVHARDEAGFTDNHPDLIQTWAGPNVLRVDHLSGSSDYQGFFFAPMQYGTVVPSQFDLRNIDISASYRNGLPFAGVLLWQSTTFPMSVSNLYLVPDHRKGMWSSQWPTPAAWGPGVIQGTPSGGSYATSATVGTAYRSPGYAS